MHSIILNISKITHNNLKGHVKKVTKLVKQWDDSSICKTNRHWKPKTYRFKKNVTQDFKQFATPNACT